MTFETPKNVNYSAVVCQLKEFVDLPNCDFVKHALIFGNAIIVSKDAEAGQIGLFFPVECALSKEFLGANNLFRKPELGNVDPEQKGFFEEHGRVKAVKFRGHKSEGFWIPLTSLGYLVPEGTLFPVGTVFDAIGDHEICRKYVPKGRAPGISKNQKRQARLEDSIVADQFRLHFDTENLRRNAHKICPTDWISISDKWHGTSVVISKVLVKRTLPWYENLLSKLGVAVQTHEYGLVYSSRKVIKAVNEVSKGSAQHFYTTDIWGDVAREVEDKIPAGFTLYGEIVGFTSDGAAIQKGYHYGCGPNQHRFLVYHVTSTNAEGKVLPLSRPQMYEFCSKMGLEAVPLLWYGQAQEMYKIPFDQHWNEELVKRLEDNYVVDQSCPHNYNEVPAEGIVVWIDKYEDPEAFKLKNFRFLEAESKLLDTGEMDTETQQSEEECVS